MFIAAVLSIFLLVACGRGKTGAQVDGGAAPTPPSVPSTYPALPYSEVRLIAGVPYVDDASSLGTSDGVPGRFHSPTAIALDADYYYLADSSNATIRRVSRSSGAADTIAGVAGAPGAIDGVRGVSKFGSITGLLLVTSTLYVADYGNDCVRSVDLSDSFFRVTTVVGRCGYPGTAGGAGGTTRFDGPFGLARIGSTLYVSDQNNHTIRKVDLSTLLVSTIAGSAGTSGNMDGLGSLARFNMPSSLIGYADATDGDVLFIADSLNTSVRRLVVSRRSVTTIATGYGQPWGLTSDGTSLYVGDYGLQQIGMIKISDYSRSILAGASTTGDVFGPLSSARLSQVTGLLFDAGLGLLGVTKSALFRIK